VSSHRHQNSNRREKARAKLAEAYERLTNKRKEYIEKLSRSYTTQYDVVFLEKLNVQDILEQDSNGRNIASMPWSETVQRLSVMATRTTVTLLLSRQRGRQSGALEGMWILIRRSEFVNTVARRVGSSLTGMRTHHITFRNWGSTS
jgi:hypothetical protein